MTIDELPIPTTDGPGPPPAPGAESPLRVRLSDPGELLAALPHLIGFRPVHSLVLVALVRGRGRKKGRTRLGAVVRADLAAPDDMPIVVEAAARRMSAAGSSEIVAVVVGGGTPDPLGAPPRGDVIEAVESRFATGGVPVASRLWVPRLVGGEAWRCYPPCGCSGTVASSEDSTIAMASTVLGQVTYSSRTELEASLAASPAAEGPRMRRLLSEALEGALLDRELGGPAAARRDLAVVEAAVAEVAAGRVLGDAELARVAVALCDPHVRDTCLAWSLEERAAPAEQLWTALVRAVPAPEVAEPATLLAFAVVARGGGGLVGAALERAQRADPEHRLSGLLAALLDRGVSPEELRELIAGAGATARGLIAGSGSDGC